jgi:MFS family permease
MRAMMGPVLALIASAAILILGNGLQGTLIPVRAELEGFATPLIGLLGSAYFVGFGLGCVAGPFVIKRVGHIRTFAALAALASTAPLLHALFPDPAIWALLRALTGLCFAGLYTVIESWLNERTDNASRGTVMSVYVVVSFAAITCGQLLLTLAPPGGFELFSLVAVLIAVALVPVCLTTSPAPQPLAQVRLRLARLYGISPVGVVGCLAVGLVNGAFWTLTPAFVTATGGTAETVATFMSLAVLGGALAQWPLGRLSDRFDRRYVIAGTCLLAAAAGGGLAFLPPGSGLPLWVLSGLALVYGGSALSIYAVCVAHANDFISPEDAVETSSGLLLTFALGAAIGPFAAAWAMQGLGAPLLFGYTAVLHVIFAGFTAFRMTRRAALPPDQRDDFVLVDPRHSPQVFELDPRGDTETEKDAAP